MRGPSGHEMSARPAAGVSEGPGACSVSVEEGPALDARWGPYSMGRLSWPGLIASTRW
jgi:hypothetical protein